MPRYKITPEGKFQLSEAEEAEIDAQEQAWADGADDRLAAEHRNTRNELLAASDWTVLTDSPLTTAQKTKWTPTPQLNMLYKGEVVKFSWVA